jgi:putative nucleotidyltransferase with HDIG domain
LDRWLVVLVAAAAVATLDAFGIRRVGVQIETSVANAVKYAIVLLFPAPVVVLGIFVGTLTSEILAKRIWFKKVFNTAVMTITWIITAWTFSLLSDPRISYFDSPQNVVSIVSAAFTAFGVNTALVALVISLAAQVPFAYVLAQNIKVMLWHEASLFTLGVFLAVLWQYNPVSIVLAILPLFVVRNSYKTANYLRNQTQDALHALIRVVDERDHHTHDHSERVSSYARAIAKALDLSQNDIEVIASAALLHDLGKIGMADDILFNPKRLNPYEMKNAEQHAEIGATLLSKFPLFDKGAILVRHHHEHYDGRGYPDGLKGEGIPLGARIIAVADAYQAMTEDRPYRRALTPREAIARLVKASGTQFDARVVQAFVRVLQENQAKEENLPLPAATP